MSSRIELVIFFDISKYDNEPEFCFQKTTLLINFLIVTNRYSLECIVKTNGCCLFPGVRPKSSRMLQTSLYNMYLISMFHLFFSFIFKSAFIIVYTLPFNFISMDIPDYAPL